MAKKLKVIPKGSLILMVAGLLLILGALGWYVLMLNPSQAGTAQTTATSPGNFPEVVRISLDDAKKAYDQGSVVFIDVRSAQEYDQEHIPGAISIPLLDLESRIGELDPNTWYITYCT
jgi:3-mercaptopyruvate sulfurtransferase SseA